MSRARANRYHPVLVLLHWTLAWFIVASLAFGAFVLAPMPNSDPRKLDMLQWHMGLGMAIAAAMLVRLGVRWRSARPAPAGVGTPASARGGRGARGLLRARVRHGRQRLHDRAAREVE